MRSTAARHLNVMPLSVLSVLAALVCLVAAARICGADEGMYKELAAWMCPGEGRTEALPGYTQVEAGMREADARLSARERRQLWSDWLKAQRPAVSRESIVEAARARKAALKTADVSYSGRMDKADENGNLRPYVSSDNRFAMDGAKLRYDENLAAYFGENGEIKETPSTVASVKTCDGVFMRQFRISADAEKMGWVQPLESRIYFFQDASNPLGMQMLLNANDPATQYVGENGDLEAFLEQNGGKSVGVLEATETLGGRKAIVCVDRSLPNRVLWLDPEHNFAVLKVVDNDIDLDDEGGITSMSTRWVSEATDFRDCGGGLWLPGETTTTVFEGGKAVQRQVVTLGEARFNDSIPHEVFTDIFPAGTRIFDVRKDMIDAAVPGPGDLKPPVSEAEPETGAAGTTAVESTAAASQEPSTAAEGSSVSEERGAWRAAALIGAIALAGAAALAALRARRRRRAAGTRSRAGG